MHKLGLEISQKSCAKYFHARLVNNSFEVSGCPQAFFGRSNEINSQWEWDNNRIRALNCKFGFYQLFYFCNSSEFIISNNIVELLNRGAPSDLDEKALAVFLKLRFFIGEDTPFRAIKVLPPNSVLEWDGTLTATGGITVAKPENISRSKAIQDYAELFREAMISRSQEQMIIPLSGGRDSRHILFEALRVNKNPHCITVGNRNDQDFIVSRMLVDKFSLYHKIIQRPEFNIFHEREKNLLCNFAAIQHAWTIPMRKYIDGVEGVVFDGIGGDVLSAGLFLEETGLKLARAGEVEAWADWLISDWICDPSFVRMGPDVTSEVARDHLCIELRRHLDAPNPVGSFFFWNRTRRCIAAYTFGILGNRGVSTPYLDDRVFEHLSMLPAEYFTDHSFHDEAIRFAFPEYISLPYEDKGVGTRRPIGHRYRLIAWLALMVIVSRTRFLNYRNIFIEMTRRIHSLGHLNKKSFDIRLVVWLKQLEEVIQG